MKYIWFWVILLANGVLAPATFAQDIDCPTIVHTALETADQECALTGRNQVCYGNIVLEAEPQTGVPIFNFDKPGDIVDVAQMNTLRLSPMQTENNVWGVALMRIQANLPDTLPGQNVLFLLFGDIEIRNAVETTAEPFTVEAQATLGANIRRSPTTDSAVLASLRAGEPIIVDGRLADGSWLRVRLAEQGGTGWMFTPLLSFGEDIDTLAVIDPSAPDYGPMQAFYFQSGIGDAPCQEAPDSGILIQTPEGAGRITLSVNGVELRLGSTAYLQAQASNEMIVNILEGSARVEALGAAQYVPAGTRVRVPLDSNLVAASGPTPPEPYDYARMALLPVGNLDKEIAVSDALTQAEIDTLLTAPVVPDEAENFTIQGGNWTYTYNTVEQLTPTRHENCYVPPVGLIGPFLIVITPNEDQSSLHIAYKGFPTWTIQRVQGMTYSSTLPSGSIMTLTYTSPTTLVGEYIHITYCATVRELITGSANN